MKNLILPLVFALSAGAAQAQSTPSELPVYAAQPLPAWHVAVGDFESSERLSGSSATVPKPGTPQAMARSVQVYKSGKDAGDDALTLEFKDSWYATLKVEGGKPLDLRPYLAQGVLAFDLNVEDLAQGGLSFKVGCGADCGRSVPYMVPGRAIAGKGWQHVAFSMSCFVHDGDDFSAVSEPFAMDATGRGKAAIANIKFLQAGAGNASCPDYKTQSVTPEMLNESWSISWWLPRHQAKVEEIKARSARHEPTELVFIGDSITQGWEKSGLPVLKEHYAKYHALTLGFGGDRTENVLWRLQHGEVDGIRPRLAVLMIGTNNTGHRFENPATIVAGVKRDLEELRQRLPDTRILLLAIFPRDETADGKLRQNNDKVNALLPGLADNKKIFFLDIGSAFLDANGVLPRAVMPDLLHPNKTGYEIWAKAMQPTLLKLLRAP